MKTYTDDEIIEGLKSCSCVTGVLNCEKCPYYAEEECVKKQCTDIIDLIKRQRSEIEKLNIDLDAMRCAANSFKMHYDEAKSEAVWDIATEYDAYKEAVEVALVETRAEAIKEFAERLEEKVSSCVMLQNGQEIPETKSYTISALCIDELVKEMTENHFREGKEKVESDVTDICVGNKKKGGVEL